MMKSPLLWFGLIAIMLFGIDKLRGSGVETSDIVVDASVEQHIKALWRSKMDRPPSDVEYASLLDNWLQDEMYYREALVLGLDQNDTIVRRRMIQKLGFINDGGAESPATELVLLNYYNEQTEKYYLPHRYTFRQVLFKNLSEAEGIGVQLSNSKKPESLGERSLLPKTLVSKTIREVASILGNQFVAHLPKLKQGQWIGPLESSYGFHWVLLEAELEKTRANFEQVRRQVAEDYLAAKRAGQAKAYASQLKQRYKVVYQ